MEHENEPRTEKDADIEPYPFWDVDEMLTDTELYNLEETADFLGIDIYQARQMVLDEVLVGIRDPDADDSLTLEEEAHLWMVHGGSIMDYLDAQEEQWKRDYVERGEEN